MTNNRKPVDEVRLSLSAARRREAGTHLYERLADKDMRDKPYTPPPNVAAWLQAQADRPKGRDYDAILRAAKKAPVGYYEDAPRGIKFGGQPLSSAGHGKDVDTADGPWPKWLIAGAYIRRFDGPIGGCMCYYKSGRVHDDPLGGWDLWGDDILVCTHSEALRWLEQNGHADVAAQLRGKAINSLSIPTKLIGEEFEPERTIPVVGDRFNYGGEVCTVTRIDHTREFAVRFLRCEASHEDGLKISYFTDKNSLRILKRPVADNAIPRADVATGGGRVWRSTVSAYMWARVGTTWYSYSAARRAWDSYGVDWLTDDAMRGAWQEIVGPERDAVLSECRKAMGL